MILRRLRLWGASRYLPLMSGKHFLIPGVHVLVANPLTGTPVALPSSYDAKFVDTDVMMVQTNNHKTLIVKASFTYQITDAFAFCQDDAFTSEDLEMMARDRARAAITTAVGHINLPDVSDTAGRQREEGAFRGALATGGRGGTGSHVSVKVHTITVFSEAISVV